MRPAHPAKNLRKPCSPYRAFPWIGILAGMGVFALLVARTGHADLWSIVAGAGITLLFLLIARIQEPGAPDGGA
jgi:uncharacterized membrane protein